MLFEYPPDILPDLSGFFFFDDQYINLHRFFTQMMFIFKFQLVCLVLQFNLNVRKKCRVPVDHSFFFGFMENLLLLLRSGDFPVSCSEILLLIWNKSTNFLKGKGIESLALICHRYIGIRCSDIVEL